MKRGDTPAVINDLNGIKCHFGTWFDGKVQSYEGTKVRTPIMTTNINVQGSERTATFAQELSVPLLPIHSDTEPPVTSDDNLRTPGYSPVPEPVVLKIPVNARLKKGKGKKGKQSPYQSRYSFHQRYLCSQSSGDEARDVTTKKKGKKARKWGEDGAYEADGNDVLDFSSAPESVAPLPPLNIDNLIGSTQNFKFEIDEDDDEYEVTAETKSNRGWGIFSNFVGGKVLTKDDLKDPLEQMHQFLLAKNVASEVSSHLCESVEKNLVGQKTGNFQSRSPHGSS
jgi:signal recognition particle receptor subunit alpha